MPHCRSKPVRVDDVPIDDPDDRKFLEAAAGGEVDFLVTNDDHLLSVGYLGRTEILAPGSLARVLGFSFQRSAIRCRERLR